MSSRYREPWYTWVGIGRVLIFDKSQIANGDDIHGDNKPVAVVEFSDYDGPDAAMVVASRIVQCVNAMEGIRNVAAFASMGLQLVDKADYDGVVYDGDK